MLGILKYSTLWRLLFSLSEDLYLRRSGEGGSTNSSERLYFFLRLVSNPLLLVFEVYLVLV